MRSTGAVFNALTARDQELAGAIVGTNRTFRALASRDEALAETFRIFPTFQIESRLTLDRLETFARNAGPLFRDLRPVARDLSPTLRDLRRLAPNLRHLFKNLNPLIKASRTGLPALRDFLDELRPVMIALDPFLANFNPIVRYLDYYKPVVGDFLGQPRRRDGGRAACLRPRARGRHPGNRRPVRAAPPLPPDVDLQQPSRSRSIPQRLATNRGNGYLLPYAIANPFSSSQGEVFPNHDCDNTGATGGLGSGQVTPGSPIRTATRSRPPPRPRRRAATTRSPTRSPRRRPTFPLLVPLPPPFDFIPVGTSVGGSQASFAACTLQANFPPIFGGGRIPQVLADP